MRRTFRSVLGSFVLAGVVSLAPGCSDSDREDEVPRPSVWPIGDLIDVAAPAASHLLVLAEGGQIYFSEDSGVTFHLAHVPASGALRSLSMGSAEAGWAVGPGVILRTEDGGRHWRRLRGPRRSAELDLLRIAAIDDQRAIAIGGAGLRIRTMDGGVIWQEIPAARSPTSEPAPQWTAVGCTEDGMGKCWIAGRDLLFSEDAGVTWQVLERSDTLPPIEIGFGFGQTEVSVADASRIRAAYEGRPASGELTWRIDARVSAAEVERIAGDSDPQALFELIEARGEELRLLLEDVGIPARQIERVGVPPWGYEETLDDDSKGLERYWASRLADSPEVRIRTREPLRLSALVVNGAGVGVGVGDAGRGVEATNASRAWHPFGVPGAQDLLGVERRGERVIAVGRNGGVWSRSSAESDWVSGVTHESPEVVDALHAIAFDPTGETGYIVGARGRMLVTKDGGDSWEILRHPDHPMENAGPQFLTLPTSQPPVAPRNPVDARAAAGGGVRPDSSRSASTPINR